MVLHRETGGDTKGNNKGSRRERRRVENKYESGRLETYKGVPLQAKQLWSLPKNVSISIS